MYTQIKKQKDHKNRSLLNTHPPKNNKTIQRFNFEDSRPKVISQRNRPSQNIEKNTSGGLVFQLLASDDFEKFKKETDKLNDKVSYYDLNNAPTGSAEQTGLQYWVNETTEAGRRKYAEFYAMKEVSGVRLGVNTGTEADLVSSTKVVEVKRTIMGNSGVNDRISDADNQLHNRYGSFTGDKIIYVEIGNKETKWPWHGGVSTSNMKLSDIPNLVRDQLQKVQEPFHATRLFFQYPNGSPSGVKKLEVHNITKNSSGGISNLTVTWWN